MKLVTLTALFLANAAAENNSLDIFQSAIIDRQTEGAIKETTQEAMKQFNAPEMGEARKVFSRMFKNLFEECKNYSKNTEEARAEFNDIIKAEKVAEFIEAIRSGEVKAKIPQMIGNMQNVKEVAENKDFKKAALDLICPMMNAGKSEQSEEDESRVEEISSSE